MLHLPLMPSLAITLLICTHAVAQEAPPVQATSPATTETRELPAEPAGQPAPSELQSLSSRLVAARRENQQLRQALQQAQHAQPAAWLDGEQRWFVLGAAVSVLSFICGVLYSRGQRRRQWLN